ncbi:hypothetical protein MMPV_002171 [Pyropia vietnamensis]
MAPRGSVLAPRRTSGRARGLLLSAAAAAVTAVLVIVAVGSSLPRAAAQVRRVGLSRSRGVRVQGDDGTSKGRIVGGRPVTASDAVYGGGFITKLFSESNGAVFYYCGGALIDTGGLGRPAKVLTAAHCFDRNASTAIGDFVRIGGLALGEGFRRTITNVAIHPSFDSVTLDYDLAIVTIGDPPTPTEFLAGGVSAAFVNGFSRFPRSGRRLFVVGHGSTDGVDQNVSSGLRLARVTVNSWSQCNAWWVKLGEPQNQGSPASEPLQVCGGLGIPESTCNGDSGGPLFERFTVAGRDAFRIFGVVSYGFEDPLNPGDLCPTINPDYYSKTSAGRAFIRANA